jgi:flagellar biosynthesis/type III secretory pathway ATPase
VADPAQRPYNPQACVVEGERIGIFIGSGYRYLTLEQAQQLQAKLEAAIAGLVGEVANG